MAISSSGNTAGGTAPIFHETWRRYICSALLYHQQQSKTLRSLATPCPTHVTGSTSMYDFLQAILTLPADLGITAADAHAKASISELTEGRSELVCLALWMMAERSEVCK